MSLDTGNNGSPLNIRRLLQSVSMNPLEQFRAEIHAIEGILDVIGQRHALQATR